MERTVRSVELINRDARRGIPSPKPSQGEIQHFYSVMWEMIAAAPPGDASSQVNGDDPRGHIAVSRLEIKVKVHKRQNTLLIVMMPAGRVKGAR